MKNLDVQNKKITEQFVNAVSADTKEEFAQQMLSAINTIKEDILMQAKKMNAEEMNDIKALESRGLRILTTSENKYYNEVLSNGGFSGIEKMLPITVIDRIFEDLEKEHPLLSKIDFVNTTGITRWLSRKSDAEGAVWGKLGTEITKKLDASFEIIDTTLHKLSAFIPITKDMLALGPVWLDKFVRAVLAVAISIGLEKAIIQGTGIGMPVGMLKDISKSFNPSSGYEDKEAIVLKDLKPETLGELVMVPLVDEKVKTINEIMIVCNPADYWSKIFPQTTIMSADGHYRFNVLPINAEIVQSAFCPKGKMIACIAKDYFMGIGFKEEIKFSDEYHFLEDERIYIQRLLGDGRPKDNKSFLVFDISSMKVPKI